MSPSDEEINPFEDNDEFVSPAPEGVLRVVRFSLMGVHLIQMWIVIINIWIFQEDFSHASNTLLL